MRVYRVAFFLPLLQIAFFVRPASAAEKDKPTLVLMDLKHVGIEPDTA